MKLTEGLTPEQRADLGDLSAIQAALHTYDAPPTQVNLLEDLQVHLPPAPPPALGWRDLLRLAHAQFSLLQATFWWANGLLFILGLLLAANQHTDTLILGFVLLAPLLALGGVALIFRARTPTMRDLELLSPISHIKLLYLRFALVLGGNIFLSLALLALIWLQIPQLILWRLLLIWSGPLLLLVGIALWLTVRYGYGSGAGLPLTLWATLVLLGWHDSVLNNLEPTVWLVMQVNSHSIIISLLAGLLGVLLLVLATRQIWMATAWR